ncbi:MAG: ORF6N domain-containing protein [Ignavibacteriales bacterium]|nr:MAG: ORF6N domain-containing protein [Ignavibacteriales bacterium]
MEESKSQIAIRESDLIRRKIYSIRDNQVMLDSDLAKFYRVEIRRLNEQVKRNINRFPKEFMFQVNTEEYESLRSQNVTLDEHPTSLRSQNASLEKGRGKHRKYLPYVFTEQGVAMLAGVLRSETAIKMSIQIINAFVAMRRFLIANAGVFQRLDKLEYRQTETDRKLDKVFDEMQKKNLEPKQGIFFDGQIFDAYKFVSSLIRKAEKSILLIDNFIDESILDLFSKKRKDVVITILTGNLNKSLQLDEKKFNAQYPFVTIKEFNKSHDRFLIIDDKDVYHFGASLKDLGKKWFAFSKIDKSSLELMDNIKISLH